MAVAGLGGVGGSAVSFLVSGAGIVDLIELIRREYKLANARDVRAIAIAFAAFVAGEFVLAAIHFDNGRNLAFAATRLPFLFFLPIYSRLILSKRDTIMSALERGSAVGAAGAFVFSVIQLILGALQPHQFPLRAEGGAGNAGPFAVVTLIMFAFCVSGFLRLKGDIRARWGMAAGMLFAASCVLMSGMRTMWPGLLVAPVIILWLSAPPQNRRRIFWRYFAAVSIIAVLGFSAIFVFAPDRLLSFQSDLLAVFQEGNFNNSLGQRLIMWSYGTSLFLDSPVFGHGHAQMQADLPLYAQLHFGFTFGYSHLHNVVIDALARGGLVGLVLITAVLVVPVVRAARFSSDPIGQIGFALMTAILLIYVNSGLLNIMFGNDILDTLFVFMITVTSYLVFGEAENEPVGEPAILAKKLS